ncbi:MAG: glycosyltransferase, partial [Rhodospirillales bacterium]
MGLVPVITSGRKQPISGFDRNPRPWRYPEMKSRLDIIIPTLNAGTWLEATLQVLTRDLRARDQIRIVDGGSDDQTTGIAETFRKAGFPVDRGHCDRGRGRQLAAGARQSDADWLLFWHADTRPGDNWRRAVTAFQTQVPAGTAGYFRFRLDDQTDPGARRVDRLVDWRCRRLGLPYGDQGLLIRRADYLKAGGYRD